MANNQTPAEEQLEKVVPLLLSDLHPFPDHPYGIRDDASMQDTMESVAQSGVIVPVIVRPRAEGGYEIVSGHRRKVASERAGLTEMPCIVRNLDDDEAIIQLVNSNAQREDVLPSERAKAYKMRLEAVKRVGGRRKNSEKINAPNYSANFRSDDDVGFSEGISGDTVRNVIALNNLIPPLLKMVDEGKISMTPAYHLSGLNEQEQQMLLETIESEQATPSVSQAQRMRKLSQTGHLGEDMILSIMSEQKKPETFKLVLPLDKIRKYFPKSYTPDRMEETIIKLLDAWMKKRQREQAR